MDLDPVLLSRVQFAMTIAFHYIFPPITIGLGALMVVMEGMFLYTKNYQYEAMAKFWTKIFALVFAVGVASGIVMEFQFGTNWSIYSRYVGDIFGAALAAEGIFAFFLESGFLAVLVFGWDRVSAGMHFFATLMVAFGSAFSAIWIVVANSWQQTPAGYIIRGTPENYRAELTDFFAAVLNPSTVERLSHTLIGALIMGSFLVLSVSAYYLLKNRHHDFAKKCISIALPAAAVGSVLALVSGHSNAVMVGEQQPGKLAAFEGHFETGEGGAALTLIGIPNVAEQRVDYAIEIPGMLSYLMHGDWTTPVIGLDDPAILPGKPNIDPELEAALAAQDPPVVFGEMRAGETLSDYWPHVGLSFQLYHIMVGLGMYFIGLTLFGLVMWWAGKLYTTRWLLWLFVVSVLGPVIANQVGWAAAEVGRQPWIVWGMLRTVDAASPAVSGMEVLISIIMFTLIYSLLAAVWIFVMDAKIRMGPEDPADLEREAVKRMGWVAASTARSDPSGESMTGARGDK